MVWQHLYTINMLNGWLVPTLIPFTFLCLNNTSLWVHVYVPEHKLNELQITQNLPK
jgi:hypothetical protein